MPPQRPGEGISRNSQGTLLVGVEGAARYRTELSAEVEFVFRGKVQPFMIHVRRERSRR